MVQFARVIVYEGYVPERFFVEQTGPPVSEKFEAAIEVTASLRVNAKVVPLEFVVAFKYELASFAQVKTGAVLSTIVTVVLAEVVDIDPLIAF